MTKNFFDYSGSVASTVMDGCLLDRSRITPHPNRGYHIAIRTDLVKGHQLPRVAVVSGCGTGHAPMPMGFIGEGMLTAAVVGDDFRAPTIEAIETMLEYVSSYTTAILVINLNSSCHSSSQCDNANFKEAITKFRSNPSHSQIKIEHVKIGDDCALEDPESRGLAGIAFVLKVAGSAADSGRDLKYIFELASLAADSMTSFALALGPCSIPGNADEPLGDDEIVFGVGIHGERAMIERSSIVGNLISAMCKKLDNAIVRKSTLDHNCNGLAIMVNNLGAVDPTEMKIIEMGLHNYLFSSESGYVMNSRLPIYMYSGSYVTSFATKGISITSLLLRKDNSIEKFLNTPTRLSSWTPGFQVTNEVHPFPANSLATPSFQTPTINRNTPIPGSVEGTPNYTLQMLPPSMDSVLQHNSLDTQIIPGSND